MACTDSCVSLVSGIDPSCDALKKPGGLSKRVWLAQLSTLDSYTINGTTLDFNSFTMCSTSPASTLKKFIGRKLKNSKTDELQVGENINTILQSLILVLYYSTSLEAKIIEDLINAEDLFAIVETNGGILEVYGIDTRGSQASSDPIGGLNASAGSGSTGVLLNDSTAFTLTLSGQQRILKRNFSLTTIPNLANNIAYLETISE